MARHAVGETDRHATLVFAAGISVDHEHALSGQPGGGALHDVPGRDPGPRAATSHEENSRGALEDGFLPVFQDGDEVPARTGVLDLAPCFGGVSIFQFVWVWDRRDCAMRSACVCACTLLRIELQGALLVELTADICSCIRREGSGIGTAFRNSLPSCLRPMSFPRLSCSAVIACASD